MAVPPRVSVVMPVHNGERLVEQTIASVLAQTFADFEFVIVNDGSTDRTSDILADCGRRDARIKVVHQPTNLGFREALNEGCRQARADLIARLDADDLCTAERFAVQVAYLERHPEIGAVGSAVRLIDEQGRLGRVKQFPAAPALTAWSMLFFNSHAHPAVMLRRRVLEQAGFYPAGCAGGTEDYALFMTFTRITRIANLPDVLLHYRTWAQSMTARKGEIQERDAQRILVECVDRWWRIRISADDARMLRGLSTGRYPATGAEAARAADLVGSFLEAFTRESYTAHELREVRRDAGIRLWLLAAVAARTSPVTAGTIARRAISVDPTSIGGFAFKALRRAAGR
jgi:glycosyltransferase involved in cell wall biosynthesis